MYGGGSSEEFLNELHVESQGFKVATKVFPSARTPGVKGWKTYDHTTAGVKSAIDDSFKALGTSKVDLYYLHAPDREVPLEETLAAINEHYKSGKFERFGISNYKAEEVEEIVKISKEKGYVLPTVYQGLYNSIARAPEKPLIPVLRKHGISYYCYNPLGGGVSTDIATFFSSVFALSLTPLPHLPPLLCTVLHGKNHSTRGRRRKGLSIRP